MLKFATSRNLVIAAGLASAAAAFAASAPAEAAQRSMFNCQGTRLQTYRCCKEYQPKPLWFRQQALNCEGVIKCNAKKYCYVEQTWYPTYQSKENGKGGRGDKGGQNGGSPNGPSGGDARGPN